MSARSTPPIRGHEPAAPAGDSTQSAVGAEPLYSLVYCSRAVLGSDRFALDRIVASARRRNPTQQITGVLVYGGGIFFQWLEGPRANVQALLERISADQRHRELVVLNDQEDVRERLFPHWAMELVSSSDIREVLHDARETARDPASAQVLESLLQQLEAGELPGQVSL